MLQKRTSRSRSGVSLAIAAFILAPISAKKTARNSFFAPGFSPAFYPKAVSGFEFAHDGVTDANAAGGLASNTEPGRVSTVSGLK